MAAVFALLILSSGVIAATARHGASRSRRWAVSSSPEMQRRQIARPKLRPTRRARRPAANKPAVSAPANAHQGASGRPRKPTASAAATRKNTSTFSGHGHDSHSLGSTIPSTSTNSEFHHISHTTKPSHGGGSLSSLMPSTSTNSVHHQAAAHPPASPTHSTDSTKSTARKPWR